MNIEAMDIEAMNIETIDIEVINIETMKLAERQSRMIQSIFGKDSSEAINRHEDSALDIYRLNLIFTAARALQFTYPVLTQLIGEEAMGYFAKLLLQTHPPTTGDWADWGEPLVALISKSTLIDEYPYLTDTARLEWLIHQSGRSVSTDIDIQTLALLKTHDINRLNIVFSPSVQLLESEYPVEHIWNFHKNPEFDQEISHLDGDDTHYRIIIFQRNQIPAISNLSETEFLWTQKAMDGESIGDLLDALPAFDFVDWLSKAIAMNLISRLEITPSK